MTDAKPGSASPCGGADPRSSGMRPDRRHVEAGTRPLDQSIDPRPQQVRAELERIERRWAQLPLATALAQMPLIRQAVDALTEAAGQPPVADLGPGSAVDQLKVLVWEACRAGRFTGLAETVAQVRQDLP